MADLRKIAESAIEAYNRGDLDGFVAQIDDNNESRAPGGITLHGKQATREYQKGWMTAFPDAKIVARQLVVDGSVTVLHASFVGTHTGVLKSPAGDIPPTGKRLEGEFIAISEYRDDKVVRGVLLFDRLDLLEQLGIVPAATAAATA
jgi:predicted ester cyclase